jgi:hypothetical protein
MIMAGEFSDGMLFDSDWNEAKAYFYRIHLALLASDQSSQLKNYESQFKALFTVHRELSAQMKVEGGVDELKEAEELYERANNFLHLINQRKNLNVNLLIKALYYYELHLRKVMKARKMDLPRQRDPGAALRKV